MAFVPYPFEKTTCVMVAEEFIIGGRVWRIGRYFSGIPPRGLPGEAQGSQKVAGGIAGDIFELLADTDYILKLTNLATIAGNGNILMDLVVAV